MRSSATVMSHSSRRREARLDRRRWRRHAGHDPDIRRPERFDSEGQHAAPHARRAVPRLSVDRRAVVRRRAAVCALRHGGAAALAHAGGVHGDDRPVPGPARAERRQRGDPARQAVARSARRRRRVPRALRASLSVGARARAALYALGCASARVGGRDRRRRRRGGPVHGHRGEARPADRPQARGGRVDGRLLRRGSDRPRAAAHGDADRGDRRPVLLAAAHAVTLIELGLYFALLSLLTFGGVSSVIPEMQRYIVDVKGWTTAADFMHLFAVAQAAPGPNVLFTSLIGYRVAGVAGSLVALLGLCVPAAALTWVVSTLWERVRDSPWRDVIRRALAPLVVGLTFAGGYIIATPHTPDWRLWLIALATAAGVLRTRVNPLWLLAGGAVLGGLLL